MKTPAENNDAIPYVSPYLRLPLRTIEQAWKAREAGRGHNADSRMGKTPKKSPGHGETK